MNKEFIVTYLRIYLMKEFLKLLQLQPQALEKQVFEIKEKELSVEKILERLAHV